MTEINRPSTSVRTGPGPVQPCSTQSWWVLAKSCRGAGAQSPGSARYEQLASGRSITQVCPRAAHRIGCPAGRGPRLPRTADACTTVAQPAGSAGALIFFTVPDRCPVALNPSTLGTVAACTVSLAAIKDTYPQYPQGRAVGGRNEPLDCSLRLGRQLGCSPDDGRSRRLLPDDHPLCKLGHFSPHI